MLDANDIKNQTCIDSEAVTPEDAAGMSTAKHWAPHVSDGLDAFERALLKVELKKWSKVVAATWNDEAFKERLIQDPSSVLRAFGIDAPAGIEIRVVQETDEVRYVRLPPKPIGGARDLPEEELKAIAASLTSTSFSRAPTMWADTWIATPPEEDPEGI